MVEVLQRYGLVPSDEDQRTVLIVDDDPEILSLHARLEGTLAQLPGTLCQQWSWRHWIV
jgi:hypothetical protein